MRGQITLSLATTLAVVSFVAAPVVGYFSSQIATAQAIADVNTKVEVVQAKNIDTDKRLENIEDTQIRLENKVDALLINSGINPRAAAKQ